MKKLLAVAAVLSTGLLGGCVVYPYGDPYYGAPGYYGGPGYYSGSVYIDGGGDGYRRHRHRYWR